MRSFIQMRCWRQTNLRCIHQRNYKRVLLSDTNHHSQSSQLNSYKCPKMKTLLFVSIVATLAINYAQAQTRPPPVWQSTPMARWKSPATDKRSTFRRIPWCPWSSLSSRTWCPERLLQLQPLLRLQLLRHLWHPRRTTSVESDLDAVRCLDKTSVSYWRDDGVHAKTNGLIRWIFWVKLMSFQKDFKEF